MPGRGEPTDAPPGSVGKLAAMADRASRGEPLFHPEDATEGAEPRPARKSLPRGVSYDPRMRKYRARVWDRARRKALGLGSYATAEEAFLAVLRARGVNSREG